MGAHVSVPLYQRSISQRYRLEAFQCHDCGHISFPPKDVCMGCRKSRRFLPVELCGRGRIYSMTRIGRMGAPPEFFEQVERTGSYWVGIVHLEEGPRIVSQLLESADEEPSVGREVEMVLRRVYEEDGIVRYGYKFRLLPSS